MCSWGFVSYTDARLTTRNQLPWQQDVPFPEATWKWLRDQWTQTGPLDFTACPVKRFTSRVENSSENNCLFSTEVGVRIDREACERPAGMNYGASAERSGPEVQTSAEDQTVFLWSTWRRPCSSSGLALKSFLWILFSDYGSVLRLRRRTGLQNRFRESSGFNSTFLTWNHSFKTKYLY